VFIGKISMFDAIFSWETDHCTGKCFIVLHKSPPQFSSAGRAYQIATIQLPQLPYHQVPGHAVLESFREIGGSHEIFGTGIWWANGI
jgi:hypothetical protein